MRLRTCLSRLTLIILLVCFTVLAWNLPAKANDEICFDLKDAQEIARCFQERQSLREIGSLKDQKIALLEKENELLKRELELKDRIIEINQGEIEATRRALNDMKEVSDRALRLAETTGKPKSNWEIYGLLGLVVFVAGVLVGM